MPLWFDEFSIFWSTCKILSTCTLDRFVWFLQHVGVGKGLAISWRLADLHLLGPPLVVALGLQCFLYAVITTIQVHVSLFLYIFYEYICPKDSNSSLLTPFFFFFFLKRFWYLYFYDCNVFTALYFSFIFWENSKDNAHLLFFNPPLTKKKEKEKKRSEWEEREKKMIYNKQFNFFLPFCYFVIPILNFYF